MKGRRNCFDGTFLKNSFLGSDAVDDIETVSGAFQRLVRLNANEALTANW